MAGGCSQRCDFDTEWSWGQRFNGDFAACAADVVPHVMGRMEAKGELPSESSEPNGISSGRQHLVQQILKEYDCRRKKERESTVTSSSTSRLLSAHERITPRLLLG
jgi:hypothetical protein